MWWVWCSEGEECWVERRFTSEKDAADFASYIKSKVPERKVWVELVK